MFKKPWNSVYFPGEPGLGLPPYQPATNVPLSTSTPLLATALLAAPARKSSKSNRSGQDVHNVSMKIITKMRANLMLTVILFLLAFHSKGYVIVIKAIIEHNSPICNECQTQ